jgi:hypothetical protein
MAPDHAQPPTNGASPDTNVAFDETRKVSKRAARRNLFSTCLCIVGAMALCYLFGAAVMFFQLPSADLLAKSFIGARALSERMQLSEAEPSEDLSLVSASEVDKPGKTFDGFTLYSYARMSSNTNTSAYLVNMRREIVHKWSIRFSEVWPHPPHVPGGASDAFVCFFSCHLDPNGDLLVVFHGLQQVCNGYGLVKLDRYSNVVWSYAANIHHDVDVGEDGTIYAVAQKLVNQLPKGLESVPTPCLEDYLIAISPDGKQVKEPISILKAFLDSPYALRLCPLERHGQEREQDGLTMTRFDRAIEERDLLHTNSVRVLTRALAPRFPGLRAGQILISLRRLDIIAVLDTDKRTIVWAARGPWRAQHDAQFLDNGHILIFDNRGSPRSSRVLEYDPLTQAFPWSYPGVNDNRFFSKTRGMSQRLPNGNTLIVNSQGKQLLEVTQEHELVWSCSLPGFVNVGRRYSPSQVPFVTGSPRPRP